MSLAAIDEIALNFSNSIRMQFQYEIKPKIVTEPKMPTELK